MLTSEVVGDTGVAFGYDTHGSVLLEEPGAVVEIDKTIAVVMSFCRCKGDCSSRRCSCPKKGNKCVGCQCNELVCRNRVCNKLQVNAGGSNEASTEARGNALSVVVGVALPDRDRSENEKRNESTLLQDADNWAGSQEEKAVEESS